MRCHNGCQVGIIDFRRIGGQSGLRTDGLGINRRGGGKFCSSGFKGKIPRPPASVVLLPLIVSRSINCTKLSTDSGAVAKICEGSATGAADRFCRGLSTLLTDSSYVAHPLRRQCSFVSNRSSDRYCATGFIFGGGFSADVGGLTPGERRDTILSTLSWFPIQASDDEQAYFENLSILERVQGFAYQTFVGKNFLMKHNRKTVFGVFCLRNRGRFSKLPSNMKGMNMVYMKKSSVAFLLGLFLATGFQFASAQSITVQYDGAKGLRMNNLPILMIFSSLYSSILRESHVVLILPLPIRRHSLLFLCHRLSCPPQT